MIPVVSLVGRPNVGKSTLFNQLTRSRAALVADFPGLTRDRQYGECRIGERRMILIDTGGIGESVAGEIDAHVTDQARQAVLESDLVFFLVDAQVGLTATDEALAKDLRVAGKKIFLVVNKADGREADTVLVDFHRLGFEHVFAIAAAHNRGITPLVAAAHAQFPAEETDSAYDIHRGIKMAVVGRPNVGKSTLVNRMLGEERVVVFDMPGTTRDSIYIDYERDGKAYTLIDTAGVRRRGSIDLAVEKFSIVKTLQAISDANVVMLVMDASEGVVDQDLHLMGHVIDVGKALVIVVNKWDGLTPDQRESVRRNLDRKLSFIDYADIHMVSALHGSGVGKLYDSIRKAYASATQDLKTPILTRILEEAVITHQPPLVNGRRIKMRYAHAGGANPPIIIIHGSQVENTPKNYVRFLEKTFREKLKLAGTPIRIEFRTGDNPYAGKRNILTERQVAKKRRLMKHVKKHR